MPILRHIARPLRPAPNAEFSLQAVIRDAVILASFTASRVSEYTQTATVKGSPFNIVPHNAANGSEGGKPIAFMAEDFEFFSVDLLSMGWSDSSSAAYVRIRFRFTKGVRAFATRMFAALPASEFCPVLAASRAVSRWYHLAPGAHTPVFCFLPAFFSKKPSFLRDSHVTTALRSAAKLAHPEKDHIVHKHINDISAHSLRVFACLCLKQAD